MTWSFEPRGNTGLFHVDDPKAPPYFIAWLAAIPATGRRFWSGDTALSFEGNTYEAGNAISFDDISNELGSPNRRAKVSFLVTDPAVRAEFLQDLGPQIVEVRWIQSSNRGVDWTPLPIKFTGRISKPTMADGLVTIELETYTGTVDRGRPLKWSHERQMTRDPNRIDRSMEMAGKLQAGFESGFRWPP